MDLGCVSRGRSRKSGCALTSLPMFKLNEWREREGKKREKIDILVHVAKGKRICNKIARSPWPMVLSHCCYCQLLTLQTQRQRGFITVQLSYKLTSFSNEEKTAGSPNLIRLKAYAKAGKRQFVLLRYCIMQPRTSFLFDPILYHLASVLIAAAVRSVVGVARVCFAQLYFKAHCEKEPCLQLAIFLLKLDLRISDAPFLQKLEWIGVERVFLKRSCFMLVYV